MWLRGRDLNPRPLGYEVDSGKTPETAPGNRGRFYWVSRGRGATPDHPKPRTRVFKVSSCRSTERPSTFAPLQVDTH